MFPFNRDYQGLHANNNTQIIGYSTKSSSPHQDNKPSISSINDFNSKNPLLTHLKTLFQDKIDKSTVNLNNSKDKP
jgi:hypothetical protein